VDELLKLIDAPCTFEKEENVVTFSNNHEILKDSVEFPSNTLLVSAKRRSPN
jgi:hypothetical protein